MFVAGRFAYIPINFDDPQLSGVGVNFLNYSAADFDDERLHAMSLSNSE